MTVSTGRLMFKGLEEEVYTGFPDGRIVGVQGKPPLSSIVAEGHGGV